MRTYPHSDQDTNGAIERYHGMLKAFLRQDKASVAGRKIRWLLERTVEFEDSIWAKMGKQFQGSHRNATVETTVWGTIHKAQEVSKESISTFKGPGDESWAMVGSVSTPGVNHLLQNWDKDNCRCTCGYLASGHHCKHQVPFVSTLCPPTSMCCHC